nr:MAG TPA: hypothetical protein [Caudoviricetes sp.]
MISRLSQVAAEARNFRQQTYYSIIGGFAQGKSNLRAKKRGTFSCRMHSPSRLTVRCSVSAE